MLLNDPLMLEASRVFAERLMKDQAVPEQKIEIAFRSIVGRQPLPEELKILVTYFNDEKMRFSRSLEKARQLISAGEYPRLEIADVASLASLMQVVLTIYNMEESITKT